LIAADIFAFHYADYFLSTLLAPLTLITLLLSADILLLSRHYYISLLDIIAMPHISIFTPFSFLSFHFIIFDYAFHDAAAFSPYYFAFFFATMPFFFFLSPLFLRRFTLSIFIDFADAIAIIFAADVYFRHFSFSPIFSPLRAARQARAQRCCRRRDDFD
jgi:hypothetical protein